MAGLYDKNATGTIDVTEFQTLYSCINEWKATFESIDADKSGAIEQNELMQGNLASKVFFATQININIT
ncbi:Peflin [Caligus rogercresseyi]|uniref:Peflin n=1 Tax=Caligus rogercresseyi TaxID=217165 RepID=A0A7T8KL13_CALRO|nr:Peflin [Caligus rogercresseyi]